MCSHNGREPGPKGLVHVSKDVSRACNGSDTRHTITSTRVDQLLIYNRPEYILPELHDSCCY